MAFKVAASPTRPGYTFDLEREALDYITRIDEMGGMVRAVEKGYPQREIAKSAYDFERQLNQGERVMVGLNKYVHAEPDRIPTLRIDEEVQRDFGGLRRGGSHLHLPGTTGGGEQQHGGKDGSHAFLRVVRDTLQGRVTARLHTFNKRWRPRERK